MTDAALVEAPAREERAASTVVAPLTDEGALITALARAASDPTVDMDKMQRLFDMREQLLARAAEQRFNESLAEFKRDCPIVFKDKWNTQFSSRYASIGNLVNTTSPALGKYGFSADWQVDQSTPDEIRVTCVLRHAGGHCRCVSLVSPPDTSGAKNPIQMIRSTITYLESASFQAVTGVVTADANVDDDGNGAGPPRQDDKPRGRPTTQPPQRTTVIAGGNGNTPPASSAPTLCTKPQAEKISRDLDSAGIPENEFLRKFEINEVKDLPYKRVNEALEYIRRVRSGGR